MIEWLKKKRIKIIDTLREEMDASTSLATLKSYSNDLLADYLPSELSDTFKEISCNEITISDDTVTARKPNSIATSKTQRPTSTGFKRKSDVKEPSGSGDKSSNKLTKYFPTVSR